MNQISMMNLQNDQMSVPNQIDIGENIESLQQKKNTLQILLSKIIKNDKNKTNQQSQ